MSETFIVGGREFTCQRMNAMAANKLLMRLQKVAVPVFGVLMSGGKSLGEVDVKEAAHVIATHLDESLMDSLVFPLFAESKLFLVDQKRFIKSSVDIDMCFTTDNLFDMYELIFEIGRFQFSPFFQQLVSRFGALTGGGKAV